MKIKKLKLLCLAIIIDMLIPNPKNNKQDWLIKKNDKKNDSRHL